MMSNDVLEAGSLDYINSYPFVGLSVGTSFYKVKKISNKRTKTLNLIPHKKRKYGSKTGEELPNKNSSKKTIYDAETGEIINDED